MRGAFSATLVEARARLATRRNNFDVGLERVHVAREIVYAHFHRIGEIDFIDYDNLRPRNMCGCFRTIHGPSVTLTTTTRAFEPNGNSAGQIRFPMFSMKIIFKFSELDLAQAFADEIGVEMTTIDRRDLHDGNILFRESHPHRCSSWRRR